ncbi:MAG: GntR family transcriptional regulator [Deltaproteobacteria bacterium]|nr:GntR family transcriptional regulator [Deltaproteobacteria bacterium]MBW2017715.1 GntR family transcriptional regulator [Deltaproteobacteria bacterium]MBW2130309.1 GntR family transcriptional regulator [Deltaproteobacteria bacterium]
MPAFNATMKPSSSSSLTEKVYRDLRLKIITGEIRGGTRLVESSLASEMNVSRTPVREALHKLALEGLVYSIPRAGYIVEEMSDQDIKDLFETRMAIEQIAARWAAQKITQNELDQLEVNLKMSDEVLRSGLTSKMSDLDVEFHNIIYRATRSKNLFRICKNLSDYTLKYRIVLIHLPEAAAQTKAHHQNIFNAFISRDPDKIDEAIKAHLSDARNKIIELLERVRQEYFISQDFRL